jgi:glutathione-regulated potassium-efflux system ancillary protein KefG
MIWLPPFAIHGTHRITDEERQKCALQYHNILKILSSGEFSIEEINKHSYFNDWISDLTDKNQIV